MSTTVTKGSSTQPATSKVVVSPVPLYNDVVALGFTILHPLVLGALFVWQFGALVSDPVTTLYNGLPVVAGVQAVHAIASFPAAGSQLGRASKKARPGEKKKDATGPNPIVIAILALTLAAIVTPALYALLILFGAPVLTHAPETFLCCAHLAVLALFPIFYSRGANTAALQATFGLSAPIDQSFGGFVGAFVGAWLGAVPIPLDWDREWQQWPITIVVGVYAGYLIGSKVFGTVFFGKQWATAAVKEE